VHFEILRLNETDGRAQNSVIAEASAVRDIIDRAAASGARLYIRPHVRPLETPATTSAALPGA
jgi:hypothetical protein